MLSTVSCSAPAKIILTGEHSAVYGCEAIASAINLRSTCKISIAMDTPLFHISLPVLELDLSWKMEDIWACSPEISKVSEPQVISDELLEKITAMLQEKGISGTKQIGAIIVIFLFISIASGQLCSSPHGLDILITTELPVGAGLGSSASICVALAGSLLTLCGHLPTDGEWSDDQLKLINQWAFQAERIVHGTPSGIDNSISCYGGVLSMKDKLLTPLDGCRDLNLRLLVVNTRVQRSTKQLVADVAKRRENLPTVYDSMFEAMDSVAQSFKMCLLDLAADDDVKNRNEKVNVIDSSDPAAEEVLNVDSEDTIGSADYIEELNTNTTLGTEGKTADANVNRDEHIQAILSTMDELIRMNQLLLNAIGVGHEKLDQMVLICLSHGRLAKLTGAGGGGCGFTLIPPDYEEERLQALIAHLESSNFHCLQSTLGGSGITLVDTGNIL